MQRSDSGCFSLPFVAREIKTYYNRISVRASRLPLRYNRSLSSSITLLYTYFRRTRKIALRSVLSVRTSVSMQQFGSHWTDFHGILYLSFFLKSIKKIQVSLKSDKNTGYFPCGSTYIFDHVSLNYS